MHIFGFQPARRFQIRTMDRRFVEQAGNGARCQMLERINAAAGMRDGHLALRAVERFGKLQLADEHLRHLAMLAGAGEMPAVARLENHMQHDIAEGWIDGMAVRLPRGGIGVEFQRTGAQLAVDFHRGLDEIRARAAVPLAELDDSNRFAAGCAEVAAEGPGEPQRLQFQFVWQGRGGGFRKPQRWMPD